MQQPLPNCCRDRPPLWHRLQPLLLLLRLQVCRLQQQLLLPVLLSHREVSIKCNGSIHTQPQGV
jgi:hypothetical protein